jgi:hypothetical protein
VVIYKLTARLECKGCEEEVKMASACTYILGVLSSNLYLDTAYSDLDVSLTILAKYVAHLILLD